MNSTKENLIAYRLNSRAELAAYLGESAKNDFFAFLDKAYRLLLALKPGKELVIENDVSPGNREIFIKAGCLFIMENHPDYEFSNDYSRVIRLAYNPGIEIKEIMYQLKQKKLKNELERTPRAGNNTAQ